MTLPSHALPEHLEELQGTSFSIGQMLIGNAADNRHIGTMLNNQGGTIDKREGADLMPLVSPYHPPAHSPASRP